MKQRLKITCLLIQCLHWLYFTSNFNANELDKNIKSLAFKIKTQSKNYICN